MVVGNGSCRIAGNTRGFAHDIDLPGVESGGAARATGRFPKRAPRRGSHVALRRRARQKPFPFAHKSVATGRIARDLLLASSWRDPRSGLKGSTCLVQKTAPQYSSGNASGDLTLALGHHPVLNTKASAAVAIGPASDVAGGEDVRHAGGEISSTIDRRCRQPGPVQTGARPRCQPPRVRHRVECPSSSRKAPSFT